MPSSNSKLRALDRRPAADHGAIPDGDWLVLVCVLGSFRIVTAGEPVAFRGRGKAEALLSRLAIERERGVARESLLDTLWPDSDLDLAGQSLNTLVYSLHRLLGDAIAGAAPILHEDGCYRLNAGAGVAVDVAAFDALVLSGDRSDRAGDHAAAATAYAEAVGLYRGDLRGDDGVRAIVERERLRATHLNLLARLAGRAFDAEDYAACLGHAHRLLGHDPCREDAHRLLMRCYVRLGERSQALRQYRLCRDVLRREFDAGPEATTTALFDLIRFQPDTV